MIRIVALATYLALSGLVAGCVSDTVPAPHYNTNGPGGTFAR